MHKPLSGRAGLSHPHQTVVHKAKVKDKDDSLSRLLIFSNSLWNCLATRITVIVMCDLLLQTAHWTGPIWCRPNAHIQKCNKNSLKIPKYYRIMSHYTKEWTKQLELLHWISINPCAHRQAQVLNRLTTLYSIKNTPFSNTLEFWNTSIERC